MEKGRPSTREARGGFAVVWCPDFRLQAVVRRVHTLPEPVVLIDDTERQSIVLSRNEKAAAQGVEVRMKTVQALARCPELRIERPSSAAEVAASRLLLERAFSIVPGIEESEPGFLVLDLATLSLESWEASVRDLRGSLYEAGLETGVGLGGTPPLARIAALAAWRHGEGVCHLAPETRQEQLDALPLALAGLEPDLVERLHLWGIRSLGAFARLRRKEVEGRLDEEGVKWWLKLTGRWQRPLRYTRLEELFEVSHEFDYELAQREPLLFVVNRFLDELIVRVGKTGRAVAAVHVLLSYADGSRHAKRLALPEPVLDHEVLFHLVGGHLESLEMKAAIEAIRLRFDPSDLVATQATLFGVGLRNRFQLEETMKRLRRLVGTERVGSPRPVDTYRPGAVSLVPLPIELVEVATGVPERFGPPFRRFGSNSRAQVKAWEGELVRIESPRVTGKVRNSSGPWQASGHWWQREGEWSRAEWDVALTGGRLIRLVREGGEWWVEGEYG
ncbi:MAG: DNA polymerase Y family protein [Verrucomicrobiota bacterium]